MKTRRIYVSALLVTLLMLATAVPYQNVIATGPLCVKPGGADGCHPTIQGAIDAAIAGDTIHVYPGTYNETAANRTILTGTPVQQGPHQFGLFLPNDKDELSLIGVNASGTPIVDSGSADLPYITTNATNNFGYSGIWVEGDNVTFQGFNIGPNTPSNNKTFEIVANGFTLKYSKISVPGGGAVYFGDWQYDPVAEKSKIESYMIEQNLFDLGALISVNNGAGYSGDVSGRIIVNNVFQMGSANWPGISFTGSGTTVPWFVHPVGGAVITGNTFNGSTQYIRSRGTVDEEDFNWASYWNDNTFDKKVMAGPNPPLQPRGYTYMSGTYSLPNTKRIGSVIQEEIGNAQAGDTVLVGPGTYNGTLNIDGRTNLTIAGEDADTTIIKPTTALGWNIGSYTTNRQTVARLVNSTDITIRDLTFDLDLVKGDFKYAALLWDATGNFTGNTFRNNTVAGYYEFGIAIRTGSPAYTAGSRAPITIAGNTFVDMGRVSLLVHDFVNMSITGNTFYKTVNDFGYAIELGSESTGVISGNTIYGFDTPAASDGSSSAGIYIENAFTSSQFGPVAPQFDKNVTIEGNEVYGNQWGLYLGNEFNDYAGDVDIKANVSANSLHDNVDGAILVTDEDKATGSSVTANFTNNSLLNNGSVGYFIYTRGDGDIKVSIAGDFINGHDIGIYMNDYASGTTASTYNVTLNKSHIGSNTTFAVQNDFAGAALDATLNWWGSNLSGDVAAETSGNVNFTSWLCSGTDASLNPGFQPHLYTTCYTFSGFSQPIDMNAINTAKAGQTIPVKWRLLDADGVPVSDLSSFVKLNVQTSSSCTASIPSDAIETYSAGSGLQYLGDGYWQFNWKTLKSYTGCRTMYLEFQGGMTSPTVTFQFK